MRLFLSIIAESCAVLAGRNSGRAGKNYYALATVWIISDVITDVERATVYGLWSGAVSGTANGVTGADGKVTLQSPKKKNGGTFTFTVTDVAASGYIYDEGLSAETGPRPWQQLLRKEN